MTCDGERIVAACRVGRDTGPFAVATGAQFDRLPVRNVYLIAIGQQHRIIEHMCGTATAAAGVARTSEGRQ
ncbi:hypothetical protein A7X64_00045 [Stenotrophomonas maltophilia]|nr:hypothetical protein VK66_10515 [Stenotrophomonas maltophilia]PZS41874.1 hypothetical protein A7X60_18510 [Stenotrophomonas maltophilia]PZS64434.1 hypothetical protein A7X64_00045 [Stenotrophomonas maltophilia]PZS67489.1 hypothetical protein A7X76_02490 [Stenotrophomonas maltophilia]PZS78092.1 hypothetical protein A7X74_14455 [Stenotrophomonas maltophilia]